MEANRRRVMEEVASLRREIANCAHCASLRDQIVQLMELLPPEPITVQSNGALMAFMEAAQRAHLFQPITTGLAGSSFCAVCGKYRYESGAHIAWPR